MYIETKKLSIIAEILKIDNEVTLKALQNFLIITKKSKIIESNKKDFSQFFGIWSNEEADEIKQNISESCGLINSDDWK